MSAGAKGAFYLTAAGLTGIAAVAPPLDRLADTSFAWHMLQHLILLYGVTLLLLLARPFDLYARTAKKRTIARLVKATRPLHAIASPPVVLIVFIGTLWATHFSPLYEFALEHSWAHIAEHLLYVGAGTVFWLPVLAPRPLRPLSYPARLLYLVVALPQAALLGMVIESARKPLYAHYAVAAGSLPTALADQANAAAVMWIVGGLVIFSTLLATVATWARRETETCTSSLAGAR